jgi:hypothetical protein
MSRWLEDGAPKGAPYALKLTTILVFCASLSGCNRDKVSSEFAYTDFNWPTDQTWSFKSDGYTQKLQERVIFSFKRIPCQGQRIGEICGESINPDESLPKEFLRLSKTGDWQNLRIASPLVKRYTMGALDCLSFATAGWLDEGSLEYRNTFQFCETIGVYSFTKQQFQVSENFERLWVYYLVGKRGLLYDCLISDEFDFSPSKTQAIGARSLSGPNDSKAPWIVCPMPANKI